MSTEAFDNFRNLVLENPSLQRLLRSTSDYDTFVESTIRLGNERGYSFTSEEIDAVFHRARRTWLERNLR